jgi:hypothetical protein
VVSSLATNTRLRGGKPVVMRLPKLFLDDDHAGEVIGIDLFIGRPCLFRFRQLDGGS